MIIYNHKVRINQEDGWGRSSGITTITLGNYCNIEKAIESKSKRDSSMDDRWFDIGESWIEKGEVQ